MITMNLEKDERMGWSTYVVRVNGRKICGITDETGEPAALRFKTLCETHHDELLAAVIASDEARDWNIAHRGQGKDWPAFRKLEKLRNSLMKEAGIKDT